MRVRRLLPRLVLAAVVLCARAQPRADAPAEAQVAADAPAADARAQRPHALYAELLGKGGPYTVGYDYALGARLAVGAAGSFYVADGDRVLTVAPYVNAYPAAGRWGALVLQAGVEYVHVAVPSAVEGWSGTTSTGLAGLLSVGYEYRSPLLVRLLASGFLGRGGFRPWFGLGLGVTL